MFSSPQVAKAKAIRKSLLIQGVVISYLEWGKPEPERPSLLIVHGLLASAETFDRMVEAFGDRFHVTAVDMPGNGYSGRGDGVANDAENLAAMVQEFADRLQLCRFVLLGHSHGGMVALRLALDSPDRLEGVVLMAPAHPFGGYNRTLVRFYLSRLGGAVARAVLPSVPGWMYWQAFRRMPGNRDGIGRERMEPYLRSLRIPGTIPYALRLLRSWEPDMRGIADDLQGKKLRLPIMLLWGTHDPAVPISTAPALLRHLPDAELVELPGIGHLPNEEAPQVCADAVVRFLRSVG